MRRIKAQSGDIAECADVPSLIGRTERIAAVFDQPEIVLLREGTDGIEIEDVSQGMGDEHGPCPVAARRFKFAHINLIPGNSDVHKNWHQTILENRVHRRRKTCGYGNDLIAWPQLSIAEFWRSQGAQGDKIGRRARVDQRRGTDADKPRQISFEGFCESACRKPAVES